MRYERGGLAMGGTRGGSGIAPPAARPRAAAAPAPAPPPGIAPGEQLLQQESSLTRVEWTLAFVSFIVYIFVITTYQLAIGDAAVVGALLGLPFLRGTFRFPAVLALFGVFILWCAMGMTTTDHPGIVWEGVLELGKLWLIVLVAVNAVRTRSQIRVFLVLFILFFAMYPARGTIFNYFWGFKIFGRAVWNFIYRNPNDLAAITLLQFSMAVGLLKTEPPGWFKRGALAATIVLPMVILFTQSRGVLIALAFIGIFAVAKEIRRLKSFLLMLVMGAVIAMMAPSGVWERLNGLRGVTNTENLREVDSEGSAEQRFQIWKVSWMIIGDYPLTGTGFGTYNTVHGQYAAVRPDLRLAGGNRDTHSTYFNLAASVGLPGLAIFLAAMGTSLLHADRVRRRCRKLIPSAAQQLFFLQLGLVGFLMAGVFASYAKISFLWIHVALLYAVTKACEADLARLGDGRTERHPMALSQR